MKVESYKMASGKIELRVFDNSGTAVTMRFDTPMQMSALSSAIALEAERQQKAAVVPDAPRQLSLFG